MCVCVCVCVREREGGRGRKRPTPCVPVVACKKAGDMGMLEKANGDIGGKTVVGAEVDT